MMKIDSVSKKGREKKITQNNGRCKVIREHQERWEGKVGDR